MEPVALAPAEAAASRIVYDDVPRMLAFAREHIPGAGWEDDATAIGREVRGELVAVCVYEHFTAADCHVHVASDRRPGWCTRALLTHWYAYPFIQLGLNRVTGLVPANNAAALKFDLHMGFKPEGRLREALPDGSDLIVLGMLRRDCRYIPRAFRHG